jgi:Concanavalin A-like lectin/glucanases superfamily
MVRRSRLIRAAGLAVVLALWLGGAPAGAATCTTAPSGLVAWYPLNEPSGASTIADIHTSVNPAPPPHPGTPQPGPVGPIGPPGNGPFGPVAGEVGTALYFYTGRFVEVAPQSQLDFGTGDFSIDAWVSLADVFETVPGFIQPIVDKFNAVSGTGFAFYIEGSGASSTPKGGILKFNLNGTTFSSSVVLTAPWRAGPTATGPWHHVAVTVNRTTSTVTLYLDGAILPQHFVPMPTTSVTNTQPLWIGETRLAGPRGELAIDELEIFNRELSSTDVANLFNAGSAGKCLNTVSASVGVNQRTFSAGQTLVASAALANPDLPGIVRGSADIYLGVLAPTGAVVFFTAGGGVAVGQVSDLGSFRPIAAGVSLAAPFSVTASPFFSYKWVGNEPHGLYVLFLAVVKAGALADGIVTSDEILGLVAETFSFP